RIHNFDQVQIRCTNRTGFQQGIPYPIDQTAPKLGADQDNRKFLDLMGLYQGDGLKEFVQGTEPAGHDYKSLGILDEHYLADKKVIAIQTFILIYIRIVVLFKGKVDV